MRKMPLTYLCIIALVAFVSWAPKSDAFDTYSGCVTCHGPFSASPYISPSGSSIWADSLHNVHRQDMLSNDCNTCHLQAPVPPVFLNSSNGGSDLDPISCVGCHGREEDRLTPDVAVGDGAGLRQHHWNEGILECQLCHPGDTDPAMFTPAGEDILPTYYADPGTNHPDMPTNPCNPSGEEDYAGTTIGLDNDGDLLYDGDDPDCAAPECTIDADCDDGLFCNGMETCETGTGTCQAGTPPCDPLTEICNEETGTCDVAQVGCTDDGDCDDGLFCNGMETCETGTGTCQAGTPPDCDDGVGCTDDSCDEVNSACVNAPNDANCPDDGLFCTGDEFCDPAADCSSTGDPCPTGSVCNEDTDTCDVVTGKVTICHIPPGNPAKARTLSISAISVADHLAHGDLLGPCAE